MIHKKKPLLATGKMLLCALAPALLLPSAAYAAAGPIDELKLGVLAHDVPIGGDHREPGADANVEVLFVSPSFLAPIFAPRPHLGVTVNSAGKNSYGYFGLTWTAMLTHAAGVPESGLFAGLGLGGAVHTGPNNSTAADHKGLGTRLLFHESVEFGYRFTDGVGLSAFLDHISNADIGTHNPGLTNLGLRIGIKF